MHVINEVRGQSEASKYYEQHCTIGDMAIEQALRLGIVHCHTYHTFINPSRDFTSDVTRVGSGAFRQSPSFLR